MDKQGSKIVFAGGFSSCIGQVIVADLVDRIFKVFRADSVIQRFKLLTDNLRKGL